LPFNLASHPNPPWALRRVSRGFWPAKVDIEGRAINPNDFRPLWFPISGLSVEGITKINEILAPFITNELVVDTQDKTVSKFRLKADGNLLTGSALLAPEADDEESYSMASRGTYSFLQQQTQDWINRFKGHPTAPRLLITAHAGEGKSEGSAARCLGPVVFGRALVDRAPSWFSSYFHCEIIPANSYYGPNTPEMRALWFQHHPDPATGLMWPSKLGLSARMSQYFRSQFPSGFIPAWTTQEGLAGGLLPFLEIFDAAATPPNR
jgi:hypothetical protein